MALKVYGVYGSPPVNSVLMVASTLNIEVEFQEVDFNKKEFMNDWFLKLNPSHTVPLINDNGFILWDSHAIVRYLCKKYDKSQKLYPYLDIEKSSQIDQILELDCGKVFTKFSLCVRPLFYEGAKTITEKSLLELKEVYEVLNRILRNSEYFAENELTVGDISILATVSMCNLVIPINDEFPKLKDWLDKMEKMEFYQAAQKGIESMRHGLKVVLAQ